VIVTVTPGPAIALLVRSTLRGGRRPVFLTTLGNSVTRARHASARDPWVRRAGRLTGSVTIGLGLRSALESR
jgi:hypothetical protein